MQIFLLAFQQTLPGTVWCWVCYEKSTYYLEERNTSLKFHPKTSIHFCNWGSIWYHDIFWAEVEYFEYWLPMNQSFSHLQCFLPPKGLYHELKHYKWKHVVFNILISWQQLTYIWVVFVKIVFWWFSSNFCKSWSNSQNLERSSNIWKSGSKLHLALDQ